MARKTHVNVTSDASKAAIIEESVLGASVPINPVGQAVEMKKRFVNPIVGGEGASAIGEIDRVAKETETALVEVDADIEKLQEDTTRLFGASATQSATNEAQNQAIQTLQEGKLDKTGGTMNGPLTVESQSGPGKTEVSEQGVFVTNDGKNGTAYDDGAIVNQGKRIVIPLKDGTMALEENTITSVSLWMGSENYQLNLVGYSGLRPVVHDIIDLPLESMVVGGAYDEEAQEIVLILQNGNSVSFPVDELVNGLISSSEKGVPNGVASLDESGKVPKEQLPEGIGGGSADMSEYVKFTDYATANKAGLIYSKAAYGIEIEADGGAKLAYATTGDIDSKSSNRKPITTKMLDYAVKVGLTTNTETLTDEERASACEWIWAVPKKTSALIIYGTDSNGNQVVWNYRNTNNTKNTVAGRDDNGNIQVGTAVNPTDCVNKEFAENAFVARNTNASNIVYGKEDGVEKVYDVGTAASPNYIVRRYSSGHIHVPEIPVANVHATSKAYVDGLIAELVARIESLENK